MAPGQERHMADSIIAEEKALSWHYQPEAVVGRDDQIQSLGNVLRWCAHESHEDALLYASRGRGAATVTGHVLERLEAVLDGNDEELTVAWVDCASLGTAREVAVRLVDHLCDDVATGGRSCHDLMSTAIEAAGRTSGPVVAVLEWPDHVQNYRLLYDFLTRANEPHHEYPQLSTVTITPNLRFGDEFEPGTESRFYPDTISFPAYGPEDLREIIEARCEVAFEQSTVTESAIEECATSVGRDSGSARRALITLRLAAQQATEDGADEIRGEHVAAVHDGLDLVRLADTVVEINRDARLVLLALAEVTEGGEEWVSTSRLYEEYATVAKERDCVPLSRRRMREQLHTLCDEILIDLRIHNEGRAGGRHYEAKLYADGERAIDEIETAI